MSISKQKNLAFFLILVGILFMFITVAFTYYMHSNDPITKPVNEYRIDGSCSYDMYEQVPEELLIP